MKVLIWIGCILGATIINTIIGYMIGFRVGYLVLYLLISFIAKKLCDKWDEHTVAKKATENAIHTEAQNTFCIDCGERLLPNSNFCRNCGKKINSDNTEENGNSNTGVKTGSEV